MEDNHFEFEDVFEDLNDEDAMEKLSIEFITEENESYHKLMRYLTWNCSGDFTEIVKQLGEVTYFRCIGYVEATKSIDVGKQTLQLTFKVDENTYTAKWEPCYNMAIYEKSEYWGDSYDGYFLCPTGKDSEYFLIYFND